MLSLNFGWFKNYKKLILTVDLNFFPPKNVHSYYTREDL